MNAQLRHLQMMQFISYEVDANIICRIRSTTTSLTPLGRPESPRRITGSGEARTVSLPRPRDHYDLLVP